MFEYLMPQLVMPTYERTLLDQTAKAAVARQIEYGRQRGVPWGMSESAYNTVDAQLNYQYRAFGVPGLGLKRGLAEDLVVAPYASVMALMCSSILASLAFRASVETPDLTASIRASLVFLYSSKAVAILSSASATDLMLGSSRCS